MVVYIDFYAVNVPYLSTVTLCIYVCVWQNIISSEKWGGI